MTDLNARTPLLDDGVQQAIERHAFSDTTREVGGMLLGKFVADESPVRVQAALPALAAVGQAANLTFTHEVWTDILGSVDRDFPELRIVGWYHTHPGHGIFLSGYDTFIHENFFGDKRMSALVIDPCAGDLGWFGWRGEAVAETSRAKTLTPAVRAPAIQAQMQAQTHAVAFRSRATAVLGAFALLLAGIGGGYLLGLPAQDVPAPTASAATTDPRALADIRASIHDLTGKVGLLQRELAEEKARSQPTTRASKTTAPKTTAPKTTAPKTTAPKTTAPKTTAPVSGAPAIGRAFSVASDAAINAVASWMASLQGWIRDQRLQSHGSTHELQK
jgi:proteasome lid subunit RPN8/RPN11